MQRRVESIAQSEFCELRKCVFVNLEEGVHAVHAAQPLLLHESALVFRAREAKQLARCVGLPCREHTAHHMSDMEVHRSVWRPRKQLDQQFRQRKVPIGVQPRVCARIRRQDGLHSDLLAEAKDCAVVRALCEVRECECHVASGTPERSQVAAQSVWCQLPAALNGVGGNVHERGLLTG
jgi:hypothetical protein